MADKQRKGPDVSSHQAAANRSHSECHCTPTRMAVTRDRTWESQNPPALLLGR